MRKLKLLCVLPHDNCTWEAKQNQNTIGAAVSSAVDTQTEERRLILTSPRRFVEDIRSQSKLGNVEQVHVGLSDRCCSFPALADM